MDLFKLALTHSSFTKDNPDEDNNERLEFYGDAVLKLVFSKYLYERFPKSKEGELTKYRAKLISDNLLTEIGHNLGIDKKIITGKSLKGKKLPKSVVGDAIEAHIGALYIKKGFEEAENFILESWEPFLENSLQEALENNFKDQLQDFIQKKYNDIPRYKVLESSGPDHSKSFKMGVYFKDQLLGEGSGDSKKEASKEAAKDALEKGILIK